MDFQYLKKLFPAANIVKGGKVKETTLNMA